MPAFFAPRDKQGGVTLEDTHDCPSLFGRYTADQVAIPPKYARKRLRRGIAETEKHALVDLENFGRLKTTKQIYETGTLEVTDELRQFLPALMPTWKSFRPSEIIEMLEAQGCSVERVSAPGTLARFVK